MTMKNILSVGLLCLVQHHMGVDANLYEGSAASVMQKLMDGDQYEELYVKYHQCVWTEYQGGCESGGEYWYSGNTPCYRANVEYSLYGVPKGEDTPSKACKEAYYINTFFTTHGVSSFADSLGMDNYASSQCEQYDANNNNNGENRLRHLEYANNAQINADSTSYTAYCGTDGGFIQGLFQGSYCSNTESVTTLDTLTDFNQALTAMHCTPIYGASSQAADGTAINLLLYSEACSRLEYPRTCRDPFGTKSSNDFQPKSRKSWWNRITWMDRTSFILFILSVICLLIPFIAPRRDNDGKRRFCFRRRNKTGIDNSNATKNSNGDESQKGFGQWFRTKVLRRSS